MFFNESLAPLLQRGYPLEQFRYALRFSLGFHTLSEVIPDLLLASKSCTLGELKKGLVPQETGPFAETTYETRRGNDGMTLQVLSILKNPESDKKAGVARGDQQTPASSRFGFVWKALRLQM